ncbi:hypothetical protein ES703_63871 [subsurface metagenome]
MNEKALFTKDKDFLLLRLKVIPGAERNQIIGLKNQELTVKIKAPAREGKANQELAKFLAKSFGIPRSAVKLVKGGHSRHKVIRFPRAAAPCIERYLSSEAE